jgi:FkbM family methyltransferase
VSDTVTVNAFVRQLAEGVVVAYGTRFPLEKGKQRLLQWCLDARLLERSPDRRLEQVRRNGFDFRLDLSDAVDRWIYVRGIYEPDDHLELMKAARRLRGGVAADIGGHIGVYTLGLSRALGPAGQVHTFEPNARSFQRLQAHVADNGCGNVVLNQFALGKGSAEAVLRAPIAENTGGATLLPMPLPESWRPVGQHVTVRSLDDYCRERHLARLDIVKIDCQGYEPHILQGGRDTLRAFRPRLLVEFDQAFLAVAGWSGADFLALLEELGYDTFHLWRGRYVRIRSADAAGAQTCNLHCLPRS